MASSSNAVILNDISTCHWLRRELIAESLLSFWKLDGAALVESKQEAKHAAMLDQTRQHFVTTLIGPYTHAYNGRL